MHVIHKQNCSRSRPGYVAPPSERVVLFSLAVVFGEIRRICQCIPNSKFFQVDLFLTRTETKWQARHQAVAAEGQTGECRSKMWKENHLQQGSPSPKFWTG